MARIRTIKPSYWPSMGGVSRDARLLGAVLISMADDAGRFVATPAAILGHGYPLDDNVTPAHIRKWLRELETHRGRDGMPFVVLYLVGGVHYGYLPKFNNGSTRHQKINRPQPSALPEPPADALFEVNG